nr:MAG TPA: hypothetical protein [Caudoviricetes sp.]
MFYSHHYNHLTILAYLQTRYYVHSLLHNQL